MKCARARKREVFVQIHTHMRATRLNRNQKLKWETRNVEGEIENADIMSWTYESNGRALVFLLQYDRFSICLYGPRCKAAALTNTYTLEHLHGERWVPTASRPNFWFSSRFTWCFLFLFAALLQPHVSVMVLAIYSIALVLRLWPCIITIYARHVCLCVFVCA